jgi:DNA-directed RNA polymerase specialized sigma24 family protein
LTEISDRGIAAVAELVRRHSRRILSLPGSSLTDLEDVQQELWTRVLKRWGSLPDERSPTWLPFVIRTLEQGVSTIRERMRFRTSIVSPWNGANESTFFAREGDPYVGVIDRLDWDAFVRSLGRDQRRIVEHLGSASIRGMARELNLPRSRVRRALRSLTRRLRQRLMGEIL